jgi:SAM-dependent methyltransferase
MSDDVRDDLSVDAAAENAASESRMRGDDVSLMLEWLEPQPGWSVLDAVTTDGRAAAAFSPLVASVVAADSHPEAVLAAQRLIDARGCTNVTCELADAQSLPYADHTFDAVVCRVGAHHLAAPEKVVAEAARVLKPGGRFLLVDDVAPDDAAEAALMNEFEQLRDPLHIRALSVPEWTSVIGAVGMNVVRAERDRTACDFRAWAQHTSVDEQQVELAQRAIMEMPRPARAYFSVCTAGPHLLSLEIDRWRALATLPA